VTAPDVLAFELIVGGGLGARLRDAYPELEGLQASHVRIVVPEVAAAGVVARLEAAGVSVLAVDELWSAWPPDAPIP
jgi:hypothetical protein